jgi:alpha-methylacyl-CoA racemase
VAPVLSLQEAPTHPHLVERGTFVEVAGVAQPAPAPRFSRTITSLPDAPPSLGQHTRQILVESGLTNVDELLEAGVAVQA